MGAAARPVSTTFSHDALSRRLGDRQLCCEASHTNTSNSTIHETIFIYRRARLRGSLVVLARLTPWVGFEV